MKHFRNSGTVNSGRAVVEPPQVQIESTIFEYNKSLSSTVVKNSSSHQKSFFLQGVDKVYPKKAQIMPVQIGPGAADSPAGGGRRRCVEALQDARGTLTRAGPEHGPDPVAPAPTPRLQISTLQCREMPSARACARQGTGRPQHMGAALRSDKAPLHGPFPGWIPARCASDCWPARCAG